MRPTVDELNQANWQTSTRSQQEGACVEVAPIDLGRPMPRQ
jgi:hypothetical protein